MQTSTHEKDQTLLLKKRNPLHM